MPKRWPLAHLPLFVVALFFCLGCVIRDQGGPGASDNPQADMEKAWRYLAIQEYRQATGLFESVAESVPGSHRLHALALYGLGAVNQFRRPVGDNEAAKDYYERAVEEDETGEIAPWAALALARVDLIHRTSTHFRKEDLTSETLRRAYREIIEVYPGTLAAQEATLYLAHCLFAEDEDESSAQAIAMLEELLHRYPDTPYAYGIYGALAGYATHREDHEGRYINMVRQVECSTDPDRELVHLYYQIAYHADARMNRPDVALRYYRRIIDEYPHDPRNHQVRNAVRRLENAGAIEEASGAFSGPEEVRN